MKYLNVLICYSKHKEENENVFFIVTNKGKFFFHLLLLKTQSQLTLLHIYSWESVIIETKYLNMSQKYQCIFNCEKLDTANQTGSCILWRMKQSVGESNGFKNSG